MKKIYLLFSLFTLLFIYNCNDNPSNNIINSGSGWKVDIYTTHYDKSADQWDSSSKYLNETYYYDGEAYSPEYDYYSFFSLNYLLNSYPDFQKNKLGKLIKNDYFLSNGDNIFSTNYKYDEQNYLIERIYIEYDDNSVIKHIIEHDKGKLRKTNIYNSDDVLLGFILFEYNVNGLISNYSIFNLDSSLFINRKYIYDHYCPVISRINSECYFHSFRSLKFYYR